MMRVYNGSDSELRAAGLADAVASVRRGELVVVHGDGAYVVIADAFSARGTARLRALKQRPDMNIPVFVGRQETVDGISPLLGGAGRVARTLMQACWPGALTVITPTHPTLMWDCTPNGTVAVRMPLHPWTLDVVRAIGPTATVPVHGHDSQPCTSVSAAQGLLSDAVAVYLDGGPCLSDQMSAVVDATGERPLLLRPGAFSAEYLQGLAPELVVEASS